MTILHPGTHIPGLWDRNVRPGADVHRENGPTIANDGDSVGCCAWWQGE